MCSLMVVDTVHRGSGQGVINSTWISTTGQVLSRASDAGFPFSMIKSHLLQSWVFRAVLDEEKNKKHSSRAGCTGGWGSAVTERPTDHSLNLEEDVAFYWFN